MATLTHQLSNGSVFLTLLCAKWLVTPLQRISTPQSELNGAVLAVRLLFSILHSHKLGNIAPKRAWIIGNSECILACLEKASTALRRYFGSRVREKVETQAKIEQFYPVGYNGEWHHTHSVNNCVDRPTRLDSTIQDVSLGSEWQSGLAYLKLPPLEWPTNRTFCRRKDDLISQGELRKRFEYFIRNVDTTQISGTNNLIDIFITIYLE